MQRTGFVCAAPRRRIDGGFPWLIGAALALSPLAGAAVSTTAFERTTVAATVAQTRTGVPAFSLQSERAMPGHNARRADPPGFAVRDAARNQSGVAGNGVGGFANGNGVGNGNGIGVAGANAGANAGFAGSQGSPGAVVPQASNGRDAAPVPEPSSFVLFAAGLLLAARSIGGRSAPQPRLPARSRLPAQRHSPAARRMASAGVVERSMSDRRLALLAKRALDILGGSIGLLLALPVIIVAAIAIRLDSRGPALFRQIRVGQGGREFPMWKLRTMVVDAEAQRDALLDQNEMDGPVFKIRHDPRVTRVGRVLRRFSIDELPQFWNVIRGQMSLVGPRPPLPCEVARYSDYERRRLSVKPGLTCEWQVAGRNEIGFAEWVRLDIAYAENWSLARDLRLIALTVPAVMRGNGAS